MIMLGTDLVRQKEKDLFIVVVKPKKERVEKYYFPTLNFCNNIMSVLSKQINIQYMQPKDCIEDFHSSCPIMV
jgi:hypothetical protein